MAQYEQLLSNDPIGAFEKIEKDTISILKLPISSPIEIHSTQT